MPLTWIKRRAALQNAASIAGLILATDCMIAKAREPAVSPGGGEGLAE